VYTRAGDSGYPLEPWLLTPLANTTNPSEVAYNHAHSKTRTIIERCFGVLKSRFRCLDKSGGTLLYSPEKTCQLITAAAVLHNYCIDNKLDMTVDASVAARQAAIQPVPTPQPLHTGRTAATDLRRRVVALF